MPDTSMTCRWVASRDSARQAAGAYFRLTLRLRQWWVFVAVIELLFALLIGLTAEGSTASLVVWSPVYAVVPTLALAVWALGLGYIANRRRFGVRLREGAVLESGFGQHFLVLRGPWAETMLSFDGIASVRSGGSWVFLKQKGVPIWGVWPRELFPPDDFAQLRRGIPGRKQQRSTATIRSEGS